MIDHFVTFNSEGSVIHTEGACQHIPTGASMGAALTIIEAATALDLPLCTCARDAHDLRTAALNIRRVTEGTPSGDVVDRLMDDDIGCLVCHAGWEGDIDSDAGETLTHKRMCIVPVLVWLPEVGE